MTGLFSMHMSSLTHWGLASKSQDLTVSRFGSLCSVLNRNNFKRSRNWCWLTPFRNCHRFVPLSFHTGSVCLANILAGIVLDEQAGNGGDEELCNQGKRCNLGLKLMTRFVIATLQPMDIIRLFKLWQANIWKALFSVCFKQKFVYLSHAGQVYLHKHNSVLQIDIFYQSACTYERVFMGLRSQCE